MPQVDSIGMRVIRFCGRGVGGRKGGREGGREVKNRGAVSACCRGRWEEVWRRGIATSTGQRSNQYWSPIGSSTGHRAK